MLKRVVENGDVGPRGGRLDDRPKSICPEDDVDLWIELAVHNWFVAAVSPHDDRRPSAVFSKPPGDPGGHWRFSRPAHGEVAHAHHRNGRLRSADPAGIV